MSLSLEDPAYVPAMLAAWNALPKSMIVIEYCGNGDPAFGGQGDDRVLGTNGSILPRQHTDAKVARFDTVEAAHAAARTIPNRRSNSILGVAPSWR